MKTLITMAMALSLLSTPVFAGTHACSHRLAMQFDADPENPTQFNPNGNPKNRATLEEFLEWQNEPACGGGKKDQFNFAPFVGIAVIGVMGWSFVDSANTSFVEIDEDGYQTLEPVVSYDSESDEFRYGIRYNIEF